MRCHPFTKAAIAALLALGGTASCGILWPSTTTCTAPGGIPTGLVGGQARMPLATYQGAPSTNGVPAPPPSQEVSVAGAEALLADAASRPLPGVHVQTDGQGNYSIPRVPTGHTYQVMVRGRAQTGTRVTLRGLVRPTDAGGSAPVNTATTLLTQALIEGRTGLLGDFSPDVYKRATELTFVALSNLPMLDMNNPKETAATFKTFLDRDAELRRLFEQLRAETGRPGGDVDALAAAMAMIAGQPAPGRTPTAPASTPVTPIPVGAFSTSPGNPIGSPIAATTEPIGSPIEVNAFGAPIGQVLGTYPVGRDPRYLAADKDGNVWVAEVGSSTMGKLSPLGAYRGPFKATSFGPPTGVVADARGDAWVTNLNSVHRFGADGVGQHLYVAVGGDLTGVAMDPSGHIWATNERGDGSFELLKLTAEGTSATAIPLGKTTGKLHFGDDGTAWLATPGGTYAVEPDGSVSRRVAEPALQVASDGLEQIWTRNGDLARWSELGTNTGRFRLDAAPGEYTFDAQNNLWVVIVGFTPGRVYKMSPTMAVLKVYNVGRDPRGIVVDKDGNGWVANSGDNTVTKMAP